MDSALYTEISAPKPVFVKIGKPSHIHVASIITEVDYHGALCFLWLALIKGTDTDIQVSSSPRI